MPISKNLLLCLISAFDILGCAITQNYLNPEGNSPSHFVGGPCPIAYKVIELRGKMNSAIRVTGAAFSKGEYGLKSSTVFMVVSDKPMAGYNIAQLQSVEMNARHLVYFPGGLDVKVTLKGGESFTGSAAIEDSGDSKINATILSFPVANTILDEFSVFFPSVIIDGELFDLGQVRFKRSLETWHAINC